MSSVRITNLDEVEDISVDVTRGGERLNTFVIPAGFNRDLAVGGNQSLVITAGVAQEEAAPDAAEDIPEGVDVSDQRTPNDEHSTAALGPVPATADDVEFAAALAGGPVPATAKEVKPAGGGMDGGGPLDEAASGAEAPGPSLEVTELAADMELAGAAEAEPGFPDNPFAKHAG